MSSRASSVQHVASQKSVLKKFNAFDWILMAFMLIYALIIIYPFYNAILVSIVPNTVYVRYEGFMLFPPEVTWDSYQYVFKSAVIWSGYRNTIIITLVGVIYNMLLTVFCAYAFNKPMPGNKVMKFLVVFTMYFSGGLVPFYLLVKSLHLTNTLGAMILPTGINIMYMLIISSYFESLPPSLEESARFHCLFWPHSPFIMRLTAGMNGITRCFLFVLLNCGPCNMYYAQSFRMPISSHRTMYLDSKRLMSREMRARWLLQLFPWRQSCACIRSCSGIFLPD